MFNYFQSFTIATSATERYSARIIRKIGLIIFQTDGSMEKKTTNESHEKFRESFSASDIHDLHEFQCLCLCCIAINSNYGSVFSHSHIKSYETNEICMRFFFVILLRLAWLYALLFDFISSTSSAQLHWRCVQMENKYIYEDCLLQQCNTNCILLQLLKEMHPCCSYIINSNDSSSRKAKTG